MAEAFVNVVAHGISTEEVVGLADIDREFRYFLRLVLDGISGDSPYQEDYC